jgi:hypothetical protein
MAKELIIAGFIMGTVLYGAVSIIEATQLHSLGRLASAVTTPDRLPPGQSVRRCFHYYDVDHKAWAECMGVGYKPPPEE